MRGAEEAQMNLRVVDHPGAPTSAARNPGFPLDLDWVDYFPGYRTPAGTGTGLCFARWQ